MAEGFDWPVLLRAGLLRLGLRPAEFWALTPAELSLMLGAGARPAMGRARLEELAARWPDRPAGAGDALAAGSGGRAPGKAGVRLAEAQPGAGRLSGVAGTGRTPAGPGPASGPVPGSRAARCDLDPQEGGNGG